MISQLSWFQQETRSMNPKWPNHPALRAQNLSKINLQRKRHMLLLHPLQRQQLLLRKVRCQLILPHNQTTLLLIKKCQRHHQVNPLMEAMPRHHLRMETMPMTITDQIQKQHRLMATMPMTTTNRIQKHRPPKQIQTQNRMIGRDLSTLLPDQRIKTMKKYLFILLQYHRSIKETSLSQRKCLQMQFPHRLQNHPIEASILKVYSKSL